MFDTLIAIGIVSGIVSFIYWWMKHSRENAIGIGCFVSIATPILALLLYVLYLALTGR